VAGADPAAGASATTVPANAATDGAAAAGQAPASLPTICIRGATPEAVQR
jgi:hypothetical protein